MKKKLEVKSEPVVEKIVEKPVAKLGLCDLKLGNEDLNKLVDKLNEIINHING